MTKWGGVLLCQVGPALGAVHLWHWPGGSPRESTQRNCKQWICIGGNTTFTYFQNLESSSANDGRVVEIKTKQMETDKTREEQTKVMNWERNCKRTGSQRGSVWTGPDREWPGWKYPAGVSAAVPGGVAASPAPLGFGLPWGLEWCLPRIILFEHLAWGRMFLSLPMCPQRKSVVPEREELWFHPTCFCPSWWGLLTARVM